MTTTTRSGKHCIASNKRGEPCNAWTLEGSDYCFTHDPAIARERAEARSRGGKARHGRNITSTAEEVEIQLRSVDDVLVMLEQIALDLMKLENSVNRARALTSVAMAALKALEVGEIEERMEAIEKQFWESCEREKD